MRTRLVLLGILSLLMLSAVAMAVVDDFTHSLHSQLSLIAIPAVPLNPHPSETQYGLPPVFDGISVDGRLSRWDSVGKGTYTYDENDPALFGNMLIGEGYWLNMGAADTMSYQGLTDTDTMHIWISIPKAGWSLIGNPFSFNYYWPNAKVTDGNETVSLELACQAPRNWLSSTMNWWDETGQGTRDVGLPDDACYTEELYPWHGYWIVTKVDKLALILESPL